MWKQAIQQYQQDVHKVVFSLVGTGTGLWCGGEWISQIDQLMLLILHILSAASFGLAIIIALPKAFEVVKKWIKK